MDKWVNNIDKYKIVKRVFDTKKGYRKIKSYIIFEGTEEECILKRNEFKNSEKHIFYFIEKI